ncbi:hypothetical protein CEUSTIGMA_g1200.t1 [Chlamydomonas eustigma]|uniref:Pentapeptide repeat-containing protein n=1 Tax=Chlamydomonas eustigma TaxID=1157962 RepID=A0A250WSD6_9CHLO|nr:hypothetical protein CEUSTIGMA_g1200.t1 [Chlamydomonas eustigma]|eukprot:GAX73748.1 hypothetical protein CEUSTIGMA_g1200.t1 [Chlamydomonas eustigma]
MGKKIHIMFVTTGMTLLHRKIVSASSQAKRPQTRALATSSNASAQSSWQQFAVAGATVLATNLMSVQIANAEFRLPPIDPDPNHCERGYVGNTIGQANAVSDRILDLRKCEYKNADLRAKVLAGALMSDADFTGANMQEAVLTKAYARNSVLDGADLTNGILDRIDLTNASLKGVKFHNAVITGTTFEGADLTDADFEDAVIGLEDVKRLCNNPTLKGDSRLQVGCRN